jgi:hypothetical protein
MTMRDPNPLPFRPLLLGCALCAALATPAEASSAWAASLEDVARAAAYVARITPVAATSAWEDGRIVTTTDARIDTLVAGKDEARSFRTIRIRTLGGIVDGIGQRVEGEASFTLGAPSIVFVAPSLAGDDRVAIVAAAQGQLMIDRDRTTGRELTHLRGTGALFSRPLRIPNAAPTRLMTTLDGASVSEVTELAAQAWRKTHGL